MSHLVPCMEQGRQASLGAAAIWPGSHSPEGDGGDQGRGLRVDSLPIGLWVLGDQESGPNLKSPVFSKVAAVRLGNPHGLPRSLPLSLGLLWPHLTGGLAALTLPTYLLLEDSWAPKAGPGAAKGIPRVACCSLAHAVL